MQRNSTGLTKNNFINQTNVPPSMTKEAQGRLRRQIEDALRKRVAEAETDHELMEVNSLLIGLGEKLGVLH